MDRVPKRVGLVVALLHRLDELLRVGARVGEPQFVAEGESDDDEEGLWELLADVEVLSEEQAVLVTEGVSDGLAVAQLVRVSDGFVECESVPQPLFESVTLSLLLAVAQPDALEDAWSVRVSEAVWCDDEDDTSDALVLSVTERLGERETVALALSVEEPLTLTLTVPQDETETVSEPQAVAVFEAEPLATSDVLGVRELVVHVLGVSDALSDDDEMAEPLAILLALSAGVGVLLLQSEGVLLPEALNDDEAEFDRLNDAQEEGEEEALNEEVLVTQRLGDSEPLTEDVKDKDPLVLIVSIGELDAVIDVDAHRLGDGVRLFVIEDE